jgi:hypothetical protein
MGMQAKCVDRWTIDAIQIVLNRDIEYVEYDSYRVDFEAFNEQGHPNSGQKKTEVQTHGKEGQGFKIREC